MSASSTAYKGVTPKQLDKYRSGIAHHHARIEQLKGSYMTLHYARYNTIQQQNLLKSKENQTENEKTQYKQNINDMTELEKQMDKIFIELENIKQKQNSSDDDYITLPKYGTIDTPDFIALNTLPAFDPDKKEPTLYNIWQLIVEFVQNCNLSEKGLRTTLTAKLKGTALSTYLRIKSKPIKEIIILLKEEYGSFPTKESLEQEKDNFKRHENESIRGAMSRHEYIIRQLYKHLPENEITEIITRDGRITLKSIVRPEIFTILQRETNRASDIGSPMSFKSLIEKADFEEKLFIKEKEKTSKTTTPNIADKTSTSQATVNTLQHNDYEEEDEIEEDDYDTPPYAYSDEEIYSEEERPNFWD